MIKAVLWDLAGVLLHTVNENSFNGQLALRLEVSAEDVHRILASEQGHFWDLGEIEDEDFYDFLLRELNLPLGKKTIIEKFMVDDFFIQPELLGFIRELRNSYTTVLVTNFPAHLHDFLENDWNIEGAFDHLVASSDVKLTKPDPRIYQIALDKVGCQPQEAVFIDDRVVNVTAAQKLGMKGVRYQNTPQVIHELREILESE